MLVLLDKDDDDEEDDEDEDEGGQRCSLTVAPRREIEVNWTV